MSEERLMILRLLEEGKISHEEAEKLLDALGEDSTQSSNKYSKESSREDRNKSKTIHVHASDFSKKMDDFGERMDDFGERFGDKMSHLGAQLAEKSVGFAEKIMDFVEKNVDFESLSRMDIDSNYKSYEEIFEEVISDEITALSFKAINGKITISSWEEDKTQIRAYIRAKEETYEKNHPIMQVKKVGDSLSVFPKDLEKLVLQLEITLPHRLYDTIKAESKNASIHIEGVTSGKLQCFTKNAPIYLRKLKVEKEVSCSTANGKIKLEDLQANQVLASTTNGKMELNEVKSSKIEALTTNGKIITTDLEYKELRELHLKTSNGKIDIYVPEIDSIAFSLEAGTSNGSIKSMIPLNYSENHRSGSSIKITGATENFNGCSHICSIKAYTTNSNINILV
ncbi:DUF4097 family beta strand repeat-containing protein [Alkaliphilus serpentinus]|uniref:DUF4097 family beta strand repeat protein n=1 Tax=Alkaliphilus serpentinus TaxID=1482731 RepID=A0A833HQG9_9FIRM|nr:DUF4097 family beta strand repeat-containing protein [Alkaliphilus serpentinus]KAB3531770.1 DUF4097 family beta strand repeat protein [Alkaliphilus serpentinus]